MQWEHSIKNRKIKTKVITATYHDKGKFHEDENSTLKQASCFKLVQESASSFLDQLRVFWTSHSAEQGKIKEIPDYFGHSIDHISIRNLPHIAKGSVDLSLPFN